MLSAILARACSLLDFRVMVMLRLREKRFSLQVLRYRYLMDW